eukprot:CAMPEP_0171182086 /NCGR_PEP_ID=MMETSP0790-20130122/14588_1 /TAXON_ID=2925 /ORGANISM="Alexandrium catenella, Strain OF101" /LENGTH=64 /DNA_ID=CAMNT_0011647033 /DNA_START=14 /DNA_END=206 /DNA_ORIENTATION=+
MSSQRRSEMIDCEEADDSTQAQDEGQPSQAGGTHIAIPITITKAGSTPGLAVAHMRRHRSLPPR